MKKLTYDGAWKHVTKRQEEYYEGGGKIGPLQSQPNIYRLLFMGLVDAINESIEDDQKPPELPRKIRPCPICGSSYFGSHTKDGKRIYYCKGHHRMPHNEYSGCTHTWTEENEQKTI